MPTLGNRFRPRSQPDRADQRRRYDRERAQREAFRRWYLTAEWRAIRRDQLAREPICRMHAAEGCVVPATVCDHIHPHRGDRTAFFEGPFQSLCAKCHSSTKQREERAL